MAAKRNRQKKSKKVVESSKDIENELDSNVTEDENMWPSTSWSVLNKIVESEEAADENDAFLMYAYYLIVL